MVPLVMVCWLFLMGSLAVHFAIRHGMSSASAARPGWTCGRCGLDAGFGASCMVCDVEDAHPKAEVLPFKRRATSTPPPSGPPTSPVPTPTPRPLRVEDEDQRWDALPIAV